MIYSSDLFAYT